MKDVVLIGTGRMARAHAAGLQAQGITPLVIGRSAAGARVFEKETGLEARAGGLARYAGPLPKTAVIAVDADLLPKVAMEAIWRGCRKLLLEKPGALSLRELLILEKVAKKYDAKIFVAYNRRFLASALKAKELTAKDGGVTSYAFTFTEKLSAKESIRKLGISKKIEKRWFIANSTHVVDLAFYLGGLPSGLWGLAAAGPLWAPHPSFFAGSGITAKHIPFSYSANWELPGPWSVEVGTKKRKLILAPLETLRQEKDGKVSEVPFDGRLDRKFKPGFYAQMKSFLGDGADLPTLHEQIENFAWYEKMERGTH